MKRLLKSTLIILTVLFLSVSAFAYNSVMVPRFHWTDSNGDPASGYCVYVYAAGTSTAATTYSTSTGTANDWPVVLDSNGDADIYIDGSVKVVLRTDTIANSGTVVWTLDNFQGAAVENVVAALYSTQASMTGTTTGITDGEIAVIQTSPTNFYTWDNDNTKWRVRSGNVYTTAGLPAAATFTIETGTTVFDSTVNFEKYWDGDSWEPIFSTQYETIYIDAAAMISRSTSGAAAGSYEYTTNDIMKDYYAFDAGATAEATQFTVVMPEDWNLGTVKFKLYWSSATGSSSGDTVNWLIAAVAIANDDAIDTTTGAAVTVSDTLLANNGTDLQVTDATGALTIAGSPAAGELVTFEILRFTMSNQYDTMGEDAWLFGAVMKYQRTKDIATW